MPEMPVDDDSGIAGLVISERFGQHNIMVAELSVCDSTATLHYFSMETSMWMTQESVAPSIKHQWRSIMLSLIEEDSSG